MRYKMTDKILERREGKKDKKEGRGKKKDGREKDKGRER